MLEMGRPAAVLGNRCPTILFYFNFRAAGIDHGFDGQNHAFFQAQATVGLAKIRHGRLFMQFLTDAMTNKSPDHREARALRGLLDRKPKISQPFTLAQLFYTVS